VRQQRRQGDRQCAPPVPRPDAVQVSRLNQPEDPMRRILLTSAGVLALLAAQAGALGADEAPAPTTKDEATVVAAVQARNAASGALGRKIWESAGGGYLEFKTSKLMTDERVKAGFSVKTGVAGIPTAFVASYGKGGPVIAILAEMDALPGKSQDAV